MPIPAELQNLASNAWDELSRYIWTLHSSGAIEGALQAYLFVFSATFILVVWRWLRGLSRRRVHPLPGEVAVGAFAADPDPGSADTVITLIHGTWARSAAWCRPGSSFRQELMANLAQEGVTRVSFRRFQWSGRNAILDRDRGAQDMASSDLTPWQIWLLLTSIAAVPVFGCFSRRVGKALLPGQGLPQGVAKRLLAIRCAGDEASAALSVAFMVNWLINKGTSLFTLSGWGLIDDVGRGPLRRLLALLGSALLWSMAVLGAAQAVSQASNYVQAAILPVVVPLLWMVAGLVSIRALMAWIALATRTVNDTLLTPVQVVAQTLLSAALLPFGPKLLLASPWALITVEPVPPTQASSTQPAFHLLATDGTAGLNHSVYAHPETTSLLAQWIASNVG